MPKASMLQLNSTTYLSTQSPTTPARLKVVRIHWCVFPLTVYILLNTCALDSVL